MDLSQFYTGTSALLNTGGYYYQQLVDSVSPTVTFIYNNRLTNPIFIGLLLSLIILGVFTFGDSD